MTWLLLIAGGIVVGVALWVVSWRASGERPGPDNNWKNQDYSAREADGTWAEGSQHSKTLPGDSTGIGF